MKSIFKNFVISMGLSSLVIPAAYSEHTPAPGSRPAVPAPAAAPYARTRAYEALKDRRIEGVGAVRLRYDPALDAMRYDPAAFREYLSAKGTLTDAGIARLAALLGVNPESIRDNEIFREATVDNEPQHRRAEWLELVSEVDRIKLKQINGKRGR